MTERESTSRTDDPHERRRLAEGRGDERQLFAGPSPFHGIDPGRSPPVERISRQSIRRVGRKNNDAAGAQDGGRGQQDPAGYAIAIYPLGYHVFLVMKAGRRGGGILPPRSAAGRPIACS